MSETPKKDDLETFFPEGVKVKIRGEELKITPFVLKTRTVVLRLVSDVFGDLVKNNPNLAGAGNTAVAFAMIKEAGEKMVDIYKLVIDKDEEWLNMITLREELMIVKAIAEVNDFPFLVQEIQEMFNKAKEVKEVSA